jgi:hypothetical protein
MANTNLTGTPVHYHSATNGKKKKKMDRDQKELDDALEQIDLKEWFEGDEIKPEVKLISSETVFYTPSGKVARAPDKVKPLKRKRNNK